MNTDYSQHRESIILDALETLKKNGYKCQLMNRQNGHIQVVSKHGIIHNYYPTTGTIAGYDWKTINGIDMLLQILENN